MNWHENGFSKNVEVGYNQFAYVFGELVFPAVKVHAKFAMEIYFWNCGSVSTLQFTPIDFEIIIRMHMESDD